MLPMIGLIVVLASILAGFMTAGGSPALLVAWSEYLVILGVGFGAMLVGNPGHVIKQIGKDLRTRTTHSPFDRQFYTALLKLIYELGRIRQKDGANQLESHIERPEQSAVFQRYPQVLAHAGVVAFLGDSIRVILLGTVQPHDLEAMLDSTIESATAEMHHSPTALARLADAFPGIGIVAAVLGIVITMQHIDGPPGEIGHYIAAALIGTFLGVLLAYGVVGPLGNRITDSVNAEVRVLLVTKAAIMAFSKNHGPAIVVEFGRMAIEGEARPTFTEIENELRAFRGT